ncbi:MAG: ABC transporter permease [bacterium]|nr:ABC transporter permease [bacterium]
MLRSVNGVFEYVGGVTILAGHILRLIFSGRVNFQLVFHQMVVLGINSIPITGVVMAFTGSVFTLVLANQLEERGAESLTGGLLLLMLVTELIPIFVTLVLIGKVGAAVTSELGTMKISEQLDALRALATDPDWYLTVPRVLAVILMVPVISVYGGYAAWFAGYLTAHRAIGQSYSSFSSGITMAVDFEDFNIGITKVFAYAAIMILTACYFGFRARGGASGVGEMVTRGVVVNILALFVLDLIITSVKG